MLSCYHSQLAACANFCSCLRQRKPSHWSKLFWIILRYCFLKLFLPDVDELSTKSQMYECLQEETRVRHHEKMWLRHEKPTCNSILNRMKKDTINSRGLPYQSHAMTAIRICWISGMDSDETQNKGFSQFFWLSFYFSSTDNSEINTKFNGISRNSRWCRFI